MITPNEFCRKCRYAECSTTQWPCRVCKRIHDYDDYFVPVEKEEENSKQSEDAKMKGEQ